MSSLFSAVDMTTLRHMRIDTATNRGSVMDVVSALTGKPSNKCSTAFARLLEGYPELAPRCGRLKINGNYPETWVADAATLVEITWLVRHSITVPLLPVSRV